MTNEVSIPQNEPIVPPKPGQESSSHKKNGKKKTSGFSLSRILKGEFLSDEKSLKHLPFVIFLTALTLVYVANSYQVERKVVKIQYLNKRVKDLHTNYVSVKAELMFTMKQTEIAAKLAESGLKESVTPPKVIRINEKETLIY